MPGAGVGKFSLEISIPRDESVEGVYSRGHSFVTSLEIAPWANCEFGCAYYSTACLVLLRFGGGDFLRQIQNISALLC